MRFISRFLLLWERLAPASLAYAHCDIPCGIYTTHQAGIAAETVEKMVQKLMDLASPRPDAVREEMLAWENTASRLVAEKEEWAEICKSELLILWTDYFKEEHHKLFPNLHETFWKAAKLCSQNKREVNPEAAKELRQAVNEINRIFKEAEGIKAVKERQEWL